MSIVLIGLAGAFVPTAFGETPVATEVSLGKQLAKREAKLDSLLQNDRVYIGYRSDGVRQRGSEEIIWLSPSLVSRWLGYMQEREGWTDAEFDARWKCSSAAFGQGSTFLVHLVSVPKVSLLEESVDSGKLENVTLNRASMYYSGSFKGLTGESLEIRQGREASTVIQSPWYGLSIFKSTLAPSGISPIDPAQLYGDNFASYYLLRSAATVPAGLKGFEVTIVAGPKVRKAQFGLLASRNSR